MRGCSRRIPLPRGYSPAIPTAASKGICCSRPSKPRSISKGAGGYGANLIGCEVVNHQNLCVTPEVFVSFYATMRDVVRAELGAAWTGDMADGWDALLARVDEIVAERCGQSAP